MNKLLVICPTKNRVSLFTRMIKSIVDTIDGKVFVLACLDDDEERVAEYEHVCRSYGCRVAVVGGECSLTDIINKAFKQWNYFDYYSVTNDDFVYRTKGWDKVLMDACGDWGIAYGDDLSGNKIIPTTSVISGNIVRALGWLQMPTLTHLYGDNVWMELGLELNNITYCPDVVIEHRHYLTNKEDKSLYTLTNSQEMYEKDQYAFRAWKADQRREDVARIRRRMEV